MIHSAMNAPRGRCNSHSARSMFAPPLFAAALLALGACLPDEPKKTDVQQPVMIGEVKAPSTVCLMQTVPVTVTVQDAAGKSASWTLTAPAGGGTFSPDVGIVILDDSGNATITGDYTAPASGPESAVAQITIIRDTGFTAKADIPFTLTPGRLAFGPLTYFKTACGPGGGNGDNDRGVFAQFGATSFPQATFVSATVGYVADSYGDCDGLLGDIVCGSQQSVSIVFGGGAPAPGTYALTPFGNNNGPAAGQVMLLYADLSRGQFEMCTATGGSLTLTASGAVGGAVEGTYTVTGLGPAGDRLCLLAWTLPVAGSFNTLRVADYRFGNDGRGVDTVTITHKDGAGVALAGFPATHMENNTTPYEPILWGRRVVYTDPFTMGAAYDTEFEFNVAADAVLGDYRRRYRIYLGGADAVSATYPVPGPWRSVDLNDRAANIRCSAAPGGVDSVSIGAYGAVGATITGSFTATATGPVGCPATFGGSFNVTREADRVIPWTPTGDSLTFGGTTFTDIRAENPRTNLDIPPDWFPEAISIFANRQSPASGKSEYFSMQLFNPLYVPSNLLALPGTYNIFPTITEDGQAVLSYTYNDPATATNYTCQAQSGTVNITTLGAPGTQTVGTINVVAFVGTTPACPLATPVTGSFAIVRPADQSWANDGRGIDEAIVTEAATVTLRESATVLNDPVLYASVGTTQTRLMLQSGANRTTRFYDREYTIVVPAGPTVTLNTAIAVPVANISVRLPGTATCTNFTGGTVTFTAFGAVRQPIAGSYSLTPNTVIANCSTFPSTLTGTFSVTRTN